MRASAFSVIDESNPWLAQATTNSAGLEVRLTNLTTHYVGRCDRASLHKQLDVFGDKEEVLTRLHECLEKDPQRTMYEFRVRPGTQSGLAPIHFEWIYGGSVAISVGCHESANPAASLRDELLLPLMRAAVAARALLPADAAWPAGEGTPLLPNFADSSLCSLCKQPESSSSSSLQPLQQPNAAAGSSSDAASACGGGSSGGGGAEAVAEGASLHAADAGAAQPTAEQSYGTSATGRPPETKEERQKRVAQEQREKALKKKAKNEKK